MWDHYAVRMSDRARTPRGEKEESRSPRSGPSNQCASEEPIVFSKAGITSASQTNRIIKLSTTITSEIESLHFSGMQNFRRGSF
jgi:hypothetical protein